MRTKILEIAAPVAFVFASTAAFAHAQLEKATPAVGGTVAPPSEIRLEFSEGVEPRFSEVTLTGPRRRRGAVGAAKVQPWPSERADRPDRQAAVCPAFTRCTGMRSRSTPITRKAHSNSP